MICIGVLFSQNFLAQIYTDETPPFSYAWNSLLLDLEEDNDLDFAFS
jgi:hypothetical protein